MNAEIKALWLEKLRDPETKQTRGALNRVEPADVEDPAPPGLCCLGVLCELAVGAGVIERADEPTDGMVGYRTRVGSEVRTEWCLLPVAVQKWAGLSNSAPRVIVPGQGVLSLTMLNDKGRIFAEIADMIEVGL